MNLYRPILITLILCLLSCVQAGAQCSVSSYWIGSPIANGTLIGTGVVPANDTVMVRNSGSFSSGRPSWWGGNYTYLGKNYSSLSISRGSSFGTGNRTSFKLSMPLDSNHVHVRVSDIRGDGFNGEPQRVQGWLNGAAVPATFTDAVNGAFLTGGNVINGASTTTSTTQSAMRAHFNGAVDSITITATSLSDFVIIELMVACDLLLPGQDIRLQGRATPEGNLLWSDAILSRFSLVKLQRSHDGRNWTDLTRMTLLSTWRYTDGAQIPGRAFYRLELWGVDGWVSYSNQVALGDPLSRYRWSAYPNPCEGRLYLSGPGMPSRVEALAMDGRRLKTWTPSPTDPFLNTAGLPSGMFLLRVWNLDGSVSLLRIIHH